MYKELYDLWLDKAILDEDIHKELVDMSNDDDRISDSFYTELKFGTAGLRGVIGAGINRMNVYTVGRATQALANFVKSVNENGSVAIAYDSRIKSTEFAQASAAILAENGIKVYIYKELMPTPMLSYAVRNLHCDAGIVVTASHNPAKYNGYKVYGSDGCQMREKSCKMILNMMDEIDYFSGIAFGDFDKLLKDGKIEYIGEDLIESYLDAVQRQSVCDNDVDLSQLKVIYSPLHGTGNKPVRAILNRIGVKNVTVVKEQELPDGNFPTAPYPNPEIKQPFELALKYAKENNADLLLATDPDCDRVGIAVKNADEYTLISGNNVGALLMNYILERRNANGTMPKNPIVVKTIVTTNICQKIAEYYGCELINVLTGFKYIGEQIGLLEQKNEENRYIFGFEESYGYLAGGYVRDKDAVVASMLICEMAAYYKKQGLTLIDQLENLFEKFGYYFSEQKSFTFEGQSGMAEMDKIMSSLHTNTPDSIDGLKVIRIDDYKLSTTTDVTTNTETKISLPVSDVIAFTLSDNSTVVFRPSGTEPKIKIYLLIAADSRKSAEMKCNTIMDDAVKLLKQ